jgi:tetratricopeptide (TPR) repeat protein
MFKNGSRSRSNKRHLPNFDEAIRLFEAKDYVSASSILLELLKNEPDNSLARQNAAICLYNIGNEHSRKRDWTKAIQFYEQALSVDPSYVPIYYNLGLAYGYIPDYRKAKVLLKKALELDSNDAKAHLALGFIYYDSGDPEKAKCHLESYLKLEPTSSNVIPVQKILSSL